MKGQNNKTTNSQNNEWCITRVIKVQINLIKVLTIIINVQCILFRIYFISNLIILIFVNMSSLKESFD